MATETSMDPYTRDQQPCEQFQEHDEGFGGNVHECFGPYPVLPGPRCAGTVSFCEHCHSDHHSGGWQTCASPADERPL